MAARIDRTPFYGEELRAYDQLTNFYAKHVAYAQIMATRPQTLYGLADSPIEPRRSPSTTATAPGSPVSSRGSSAET